MCLYVNCWRKDEPTYLNEICYVGVLQNCLLEHLENAVVKTECSEEVKRGEKLCK